MATLTPTIKLESTDATSDSLSFTVNPSVSVTDPSVGLSKIAATTTGGDTIIVPDHSDTRYLYLKHTGKDASDSAVTTTLNVETADDVPFAKLSANEWMFVPVGGAKLKIQLEASASTIIAEYAYWTKV